MKYIIYKMVQPSHLKEIEPDGYYQKIVHRSVLESLDVTGVEKEHSTMESAINEINDKRDMLKYLQLTVLPVLSIDWEGVVS